MITDFRRKQNVKDPVTINGSEFDVVKTYKYLGVTIQEDLKWDSHIDNQLKKCNKRMHHVRCLKKLNIDHKIIVLFHNFVISSLLTYAISSWYSACSIYIYMSFITFEESIHTVILYQYKNTNTN